MSCIRCDSTEVIGGKVLEHMVCSNYDFEENFNIQNGKVSCQKCGDSAPGTDYVQRGLGYKCLSCSFFMDEPRTLITCVSCGYSLAKERNLSFNPKRPRVDLHGRASSLESIVRKVRARGWFALPFRSLVGKSGVEHEFSLVVSETPVMNGHIRGGRLLVAELISSTRHLGKIQLLTFFAKALDVGVKNRILVAIPKLEDDAKKFADSYGIIVLESPSPEAALDALAAKVGEMMEKSPSHQKSDKTESSTKRTSFDIIADILTIAEKPISKTEILYRANLSFKQAEKYLTMLEKMELLRKYFEDGANRRFVTTQKGGEYLLNTLKQFGRVSEGSNSVWGSKKNPRLL